MQCEKCGYINKQYDIICQKCGSPLNIEKNIELQKKYNHKFLIVPKKRLGMF